MGKQHGHGRVHQEEEDEKGFGGGKKIWHVGGCAPERADSKGENKADEVEFAPGIKPGNAQDAAVEQGVVGKEQHMAACAGGQQHRCKKATDGSCCRKPAGILQHRHGTGQSHQADHHRQSQRVRQEMVELGSSKNA